MTDLAMLILFGVVSVFAIGVVVAILPIGAERQRRADESVDAYLREKAEAYGTAATTAMVESALTGGRITPATAQRFVDRGWLATR